MKVKASRQQVLDELFRRGELIWILYPHQRPIYNKIREVLSTDDVTMNSYVIDCARQFGKSFIMFIIAVEECLREPNRTVVFIGPLKSQVNEIVDGNTFNVIFRNCPADLIPAHKDSALIFQNGSRIRLSGTDNKNYNSLRGGAAHTIFLDEAGFLSDLDTGVIPVITPMTKTTNGKVIFASTPPDTLDHPYIEILREHDESGLISTFTIWDDKSLTERQLNKIINQCKGQDTTLFKREYECKRIVETSLQVIPELIEEHAQTLIIDSTYKQDPLLQYWKKYVVVDTGVRDHTAVIFAHYNYHTKKLVLEDSLSLSGVDYNTARLADMIKGKVLDLWPNPEYQKGISYIADSNNLIVIQDLNVIYKLNFVPTSKGTLEQMVQLVRDWVYDSRITFAPNALDVLECSKFAIWSKSRNEFSRSPKYGHYDLTASLTYLVRNVDFAVDPVPNLLGFNKVTQFVDPYAQQQTQNDRQQLSNIFSPRSGLSFRR